MFTKRTRNPRNFGGGIYKNKFLFLPKSSINEVFRGCLPWKYMKHIRRVIEQDEQAFYEAIAGRALGDQDIEKEYEIDLYGATGHWTPEDFLRNIFYDDINEDEILASWDPDRDRESNILGKQYPLHLDEESDDEDELDYSPDIIRNVLFEALSLIHI